MMFAGPAAGGASLAILSPAKNLAVVPEKTYITIATYNERDNVEPLLAQIRDRLPAARVIVTDDNSPDGTGEVLDALAARDEHLEVIHRPGKLGYASAHIAGMQQALAAGADALVQMDADFSHDPASLPEIVAQLDEHDLVIGSRWAPGGATENWGWHRVALSRWASFYARTLLGLRARDCTSGFRAYRREIAEQIKLTEAQSDGYSFLVEGLFRVVQAGGRVAEVPIVFRERRYGKSKLSKRIIFESAWLCLRLFGERLFRRCRA
jgi:dolichol-phosphate mannosyltransferase